MNRNLKKITISYKKPLILLLVFLFVPVIPGNSIPQLSSSQSYEESVIFPRLQAAEWFTTLVDTSGRGFALAGITFSNESGADMWFVKTDERGFKKWNRTYGGSGDEVANKIIRTKNGDFVLAGSTTSYGSGSSDMWLVKTDPTGIMKWNRTYGNEGKELCYYLEETMDGGFALMGVTYPNETAPGEILLVKTDTLGVMQWNRTYALPEDFPISDPGFQDFFVVSDQTSDYLYGESSLSRVISFMETDDGGFIFILPNNQEKPFQLFKTDDNGIVQWKKTLELGIDLRIELHDTKHFQSHNRVCIKETSDNGFIIGITYSAGWCGGMINKGYKAMLAKTDVAGIIQWTKKWEDLSTIEAVFPGNDGIIAWIWSIDNHVTISNIGLDGTWYWNTTCLDEDWTFSVWWAACGVWFAGVPLDTIITSTGEYMIAGITTPPFNSTSIDAWLTKRDTNGNLLWKHIYRTNEDFRVLNNTSSFSSMSTSDPTTTKIITNIEQDTNNDQTSRGFIFIPLLVGMIFLRFWFRRRRV